MAFVPLDDQFFTRDGSDISTTWGEDIYWDGSGVLDSDRRPEFRMIEGQARVRQQVEITLRTWMGEWFLDTSWGVPVVTKILVKSPRRAEIETIIRAKVLDVPNVIAVPTVTVEIDAATRRARITLPDITTDFGQITVVA